MRTVQEPQQKISDRAIQVFRLTNLLSDVLILIVLIAILWIAYYFSWPNWLQTIGWVLIGVFPFFMFWSVFIEPILIQRYWCYGLNEEFLRLQSGKFTQTDTVIPMEKIQYVEVEQGPILRRYGLYSLTVGTLSSSHEIPALPEKEAFRVRDLIAHQANIPEVEDS